MFYPGPFHFQADQIWPDGTFKQTFSVCNIRLGLNQLVRGCPFSTGGWSLRTIPMLKRTGLPGKYFCLYSVEICFSFFPKASIIHVIGGCDITVDPETPAP
jgi:hypothetical protein